MIWNEKALCCSSDSSVSSEHSGWDGISVSSECPDENNDVPFATGFHEASPCCKPTSLGTAAGRRCRPERSVPCHFITLALSFSTGASLVLLLCVGGCQNIHTCWFCLCNCNETMNSAWCCRRVVSLLLLLVLYGRSRWGVRLNIVGLTLAISWFSSLPSSFLPFLPFFPFPCPCPFLWKYPYSSR